MSPGILAALDQLAAATAGVGQRCAKQCAHVAHEPCCVSWHALPPRLYFHVHAVPEANRTRAASMLKRCVQSRHLLLVQKARRHMLGRMRL